MSQSSLPEWKQMLLERKRKEEEEREKREREEKERLANMPAWKRGLIQRKRAKQDGGREKDRERDKESGFQVMDYRAGAENDKDTQTVLLLEFGTESKPHNQVSVETIGRVRENPFVRYQDAKRKDREGEKGEEMFKEKGGEWEKGTGTTQESRMETEKPGDIHRKSSSHYIVWGKDRGADLTRKDITSEPIEKGKVWEEETEEGRRQWLRHTSEGQGKRVDLKETLACGWTVSEISASGVLLIKPLANLGVGAEGPKRQTKENEMAIDMERSEKKEQTLVEREFDGRSGTSWFQKQRESITWDEISRNSKRERSRGSLKMGEISGINMSRQHETEGKIERGTEREGQESGLDSKGLAEGRGRVRQLLSKFGECRKRPSRSKSSDCCDRTKQEHWNPQPRLSLGEKEDMERRRRKGEDNQKDGGRGPKRSVSFSNSDRLFIDKEDPRIREMHSGRSEITGDKEDSSRIVIRRSSSPNKAAPRQSVVPEAPQATKPTQSEGRALTNTGKERQVVQEAGRETPALMQKSVEKAGDKEKERKEHFNRENALVVEVPFRQVLSGKAANHKDDEEHQEMQNMTMKEHQRREREKGEQKWQNKESPVNLRRKDVGTRTCKTEPNQQQSITAVPAMVERDMSLLSEEQEDSVQCDKIHFRNSFNESFILQCSMLDSERDNIDLNLTSDAVLEHQDTNSDKQKGRRKEREMNTWLHTLSDNMREKHTSSDENYFRETQREGRETDRPGSHCEGLRETCVDMYTERKSDMKMQSPKIAKVPFCEVELVEEIGEMKLEVLSEKGVREEEEGMGLVRRGSWKAGRPLTRIESLREKLRQKELEKQRQKMKESGNLMGKWEGEEEWAQDQKVEIKGVSVWEEEEKPLPEKGVQRATVEEEEPRGRQQKVILSLVSCPPETAFRTGSPKHYSQFFSDTEGEEQRTFAVKYSHHMGFIIGGRAEEEISSAEECNTHHQIRQGAADGTEDEKMLEELYDPPYLPPSLSPSPPTPYSPSPPSPDGTISPACNPASSAFSITAENITASRMLPSVKIEQEYQTNPCSPKTVPDKPLCGRKSNQGLEPKIKRQQVWSEDAPEESAEFQAAEEQFKQLQYSETQSQRMQTYEQLQQEEKEFYGQRLQAEEQHALTGQKAPCLPRQQSVPPRKNQLKQAKSTFPTAVNPKSTMHPKNSLKIPKDGRNAISPSPSPSPESSSLQSIPGVQVRRGNTITITPRKAGESSVTSTGMTVTPPPTRAADTHNAVYKNRRRYPAVEEIEVIGGYQSLEKSCLSRKRRPHKEVNVCFDEVCLEQVCEYPSETSMLASLPSPPLPGSERKTVEEVEEEVEEEEQEQREVSVFKSTRNELRVDESSRR